MANLPPSPIVTWTDGEEPDNIPNADDLNLDWRDNFNFLIGNTRPLIYLESSTGQSIPTANTYVTINFQVEFVKRGDMVHAVNGSGITVPVAGQYIGFALGSFEPVSTLATRCYVQINNNGSQIAVANSRPEIVGDHQVHTTFTANLAANDVITMAMKSQVGTATSSVNAFRRPKIAMWYAGKFA